MQESQSKGGLTGALDNLSEREQMLVKVMLGVFAVLTLALIIGLSQRALADLESQSRQYEAALQLLATHGPDYARASRGGEADGPVSSRVDLFTEDILQNNPVNLRALINEYTTEVGITWSRANPEDIPLGTVGEDGPVIQESQLRIDFHGAQMDRLIEFLHLVEESRHPIVTTEVDVRSTGDEGRVRALVIVSTYEYLSDEES